MSRGESSEHDVEIPTVNRDARARAPLLPAPLGSPNPQGALARLPATRQVRFREQRGLLQQRTTERQLGFASHYVINSLQKVRRIFTLSI